MKKTFFKHKIPYLVFLLFLCTLLFSTTSYAASISKKKLNMAVGDTFQLKLKGTNKKAIWKSSKSSVVSVTSNGTLKAKKYGKAVITAKVGKQSYKCNVFVSKNIIDVEIHDYHIFLDTISFKIKNNSCSALTFEKLLGLKNNKYNWITPLALRNPTAHKFIEKIMIPAGKERTIYFCENPTFQYEYVSLPNSKQLILPFKCQNRNYTIFCNDFDFDYTLKVKRIRTKIPIEKTLPLPEPEYATTDKYNQITTGMNYNQVRDIMGFEGDLLNSSNNAYASYQYYKWYGKENYTAVYVYFRNGVVFSTSQYGL